MGRPLIFFLVGVGLVGGGIWGAFVMNQRSHPQLSGSILKVRTMADGDGAIVFADFRVTNTSAVPFVVGSVTMTMETPEDEFAKAVTLSKSEVEQMTKAVKLLGPKYNDVLGVKDKIPPVEITDRMLAARFPFPPRFLEQRKTLRLRIEEVDGAVSEIVEKTAEKSPETPAKK